MAKGREDVKVEWGIRALCGVGVGVAPVGEGGDEEGKPLLGPAAADEDEGILGAEEGMGARVAVGNGGVEWGGSVLKWAVLAHSARGAVRCGDVGVVR